MKGHIRKHGDGYQAIMYLGRGPDGKPRYRYFTVQPTREAAQALLIDALSKRLQGTYVAPTRMTVGELLDRWLAHVEARRPRTYPWYRYVVEAHLRPGLGHIPLQQLTPMDVDEHYARELRKGRKADGWGKRAGDGLAPATVHAQHRVLRAALRQAVRWRLLASNPMDQVTTPEPGWKEHRALTAAQARTLMAVAEEHARYPELYVLAMTTGMRQGELLALRWSDLEIPLCYVRHALKRPHGGGWRLEAPKTERGVRTIWLLPQAIEALERVRVRQQAEKALAGDCYQDHGFVFSQPNGEPLDGHNISQREFKHLLELARLPTSVRFHDLRHTAATLLREAGVDSITIQAILGHADLATTQRYTAVVLDVLQDAAARLEGVLFGNKKGPA